MPNEDEWERAARGADGRFFPWGDWFDPSLCGMEQSREPVNGRRPTNERVGFFPADESPFGARDMAGSIRNWTSTGNERTRIVKGGSWGNPAAWCRSAGRLDNGTSFTNGPYGVRLAARRASGEDS